MFVLFHVEIVCSKEETAEFSVFTNHDAATICFKVPSIILNASDDKFDPARLAE